MVPTLAMEPIQRQSWGPVATGMRNEQWVYQKIMAFDTIYATEIAPNINMLYQDDQNSG